MTFFAAFQGRPQGVARRGGGTETFGSQRRETQRRREEASEAEVALFFVVCLVFDVFSSDVWIVFSCFLKSSAAISFKLCRINSFR